MSSLNQPKATLQLLHNKPRTCPVLWSWSTDKCLNFPLYVEVSGRPQIAQTPSCLSNISLYSSRVMPKVSRSFSFFSKSGFFLRRSLRFLLLHFLQLHICPPLCVGLLWKAITGNRCLQYPHILVFGFSISPYLN